ncbi:serine O-acetyltransferase [Floricoccus penangensis]|uniref:Serine acetyltransferase n=1 Tax=Floricoccus penangensis TaxID=1859475 RepID=A0A9Q5JGL8_9LACT|nr:serine O-acetyltransferase EpsC [Floricoccus penangensis]OFI46935.1 serine O-acetyltransferase [Floricoccus penangensis]
MRQYIKYIDGLLTSAVEKDPATTSKLEAYLFTPGVQALANHYRAHRLFKKGKTFRALMIAKKSRRKTGIEIHPAAVIGERVFIDHGMGIVIGGTAIVEDDVTIYHGVTLGGIDLSPDSKRHPTVKKGAMLGAGSTILGDITIGKNSKVGANSLVLKDVPDNTTAVGSPVRIIKH